MKQNVGMIDRAFRTVVGIALIAWAVFGASEFAWVGWFGVVPLLTAIAGWCPPYSLLGISTCSTRNAVK